MTGETERASAVAGPDARPRVLIVSPQAFFAVAGTPINVLQMVRALGDLGYEVHLLTLPLGEDVDVPHLVYHRVMRLPYITHVPVGFSYAKALYNIVLFFALIGLLAKQKFVALQAIEESAFYAVPLARLFKVPGISDLDSDISAQLLSNPSAAVRAMGTAASYVQRWSLRRGSAAVTVAKHLTDLVKETAPGLPVFEITDIPLDAALRTPDDAKVCALRSKFGGSDRPLLVYTGNFDPRQGIEVLIESMSAVRERFPEALLLLVGGEEQEIDRLKAYVRSLDLGHSVRFLGKQPPDTMPEYMALATVLVSPRLEPLVTPLKIYSYMVSGRPIVATDLPTHTQVLDAQSAVLAEPTADGLAAGLIKALEDPETAEVLGRQAKTYVLERHSFEHFKAEIRAAYDRIAAAPDAPDR
ncbi:MAG TPA: glycosyltransferase family 4 protein [Kiloniellaceae bacterium]|nr:glycosyltransferase family 4 protein [Kiloniellaceae bacterium]